jgi:hypothetical protein
MIYQPSALSCEFLAMEARGIGLPGSPPGGDSGEEFSRQRFFGFVCPKSVIVSEADSAENGTKMTHHFGKLPVVLKISALLVGAPLVILGVGSMMSDMAQVVRLRSFTAAPHFGLELGPVFALVGLSFLWPLRPTASQNH